MTVLPLAASILLLGGCTSQACREARAAEQEAGKAYVKASQTSSALSAPYLDCDTTEGVAAMVKAGTLKNPTRHSKDYCAAADKAYAEASLAFDVTHRAWKEAGKLTDERCK